MQFKRFGIYLGIFSIVLSTSASAQYAQTTGPQSTTINFPTTGGTPQPSGGSVSNNNDSDPGHGTGTGTGQTNQPGATTGGQTSPGTATTPTTTTTQTPTQNQQQPSKTGYIPTLFNSPDIEWIQKTFAENPELFACIVGYYNELLPVDASKIQRAKINDISVNTANGLHRVMKNGSGSNAITSIVFKEQIRRTEQGIVSLIPIIGSQIKATLSDNGCKVTTGHPMTTRMVMADRISSASWINPNIAKSSALSLLNADITKSVSKAYYPYKTQLNPAYIVKVITQNPAGDYQVIVGSDGNVLKVVNQTKAWSLSDLISFNGSQKQPVASKQIQYTPKQIIKRTNLNRLPIQNLPPTSSSSGDLKYKIYKTSFNSLVKYQESGNTTSTMYVTISSCQVDSILKRIFKDTNYPDITIETNGLFNTNENSNICTPNYTESENLYIYNTNVLLSTLVNGKSILKGLPNAMKNSQDWSSTEVTINPFANESIAVFRPYEEKIVLGKLFSTDINNSGDATASMDDKVNTSSAGYSKNFSSDDVWISDGDVALHELGHVWLYLRQPEIASPDGLALHEAIADWFASFTSGNQCIAEWVSCATGQLSYDGNVINDPVVRLANGDVDYIDNQKLEACYQGNLNYDRCQRNLNVTVDSSLSENARIAFANYYNNVTTQLNNSSMTADKRKDALDSLNRFFHISSSASTLTAQDVTWLPYYWRFIYNDGDNDAMNELFAPGQLIIHESSQLLGSALWSLANKINLHSNSNNGLSIVHEAVQRALLTMDTSSINLLSPTFPHFLKQVYLALPSTQRNIASGVFFDYGFFDQRNAVVSDHFLNASMKMNQLQVLVYWRKFVNDQLSSGNTQNSDLWLNTPDAFMWKGFAQSSHGKQWLDAMSKDYDQTIKAYPWLWPSRDVSFEDNWTAWSESAEGLNWMDNNLKTPWNGFLARVLAISTHQILRSGSSNYQTALLDNTRFSKLIDRADWEAILQTAWKQLKSASSGLTDPQWQWAMLESTRTQYFSDVDEWALLARHALLTELVNGNHKDLSQLLSSLLTKIKKSSVEENPFTNQLDLLNTTWLAKRGGWLFKGDVANKTQNTESLESPLQYQAFSGQWVVWQGGYSLLTKENPATCQSSSCEKMKTYRNLLYFSNNPQSANTNWDLIVGWKSRYGIFVDYATAMNQDFENMTEAELEELLKKAELRGFQGLQRVERENFNHILENITDADARDKIEAMMLLGLRDVSNSAVKSGINVSTSGVSDIDFDDYLKFVSESHGFRNVTDIYSEGVMFNMAWLVNGSGFGFNMAWLVNGSGFGFNMAWLVNGSGFGFNMAWLVNGSGFGFSNALSLELDALQNASPTWTSTSSNTSQIKRQYQQVLGSDFKSKTTTLCQNSNSCSSNNTNTTTPIPPRKTTQKPATTTKKSGAYFVRCLTSQHLVKGKCVANKRSLKISNGIQLQSWVKNQWVNSQKKCHSGYTLIKNQCVNSKTCSIKNGSGLQQYKQGRWGRCMVSSCDKSYHQSGQSCINDVRQCRVKNGQGYQAWSNKRWGRCAVTFCNRGYRKYKNQCVSSQRKSTSNVRQIKSISIPAR